jgi:hypothetical protein
LSFAIPCETDAVDSEKNPFNERLNGFR